MNDMEALRKAVALWEKQPLEPATSYRLVLAAVAAYAEGREAWECETHRFEMKPDAEKCLRSSMYGGVDCRMVRVLICPYNETEGGLIWTPRD